MCRLLGYVASAPTPLYHILGMAGFDAFTELSAMHRDGWGMAWPGPHGTIEVAKSAEPAQRSADYGHLAASPLSDIGLVHLRWATPPHAVRPENNHPFLGDGVAFAHNGAIVPAADVERLVDPELLPELAGTTDSERFFLAIRSRLRAGENMLAALQWTVGHIVGRLATSSLNCLLLTDSTLYAVSCHDPLRTPVPQQPTYFHLHYRRFPDAVVVASSGWSRESWQEVPNGSVLVVRRRTMVTEIVPLGVAPERMRPEPAAAAPR